MKQPFAGRCTCAALLVHLCCTVGAPMLDCWYSYAGLLVFLCCTFGTRVLHFSGTVFSICLHLIHILIFFVIRLLLFVNTVITYIPFCLLARFIRPLSFCSYNIRPVKSIIVTCFTSFAKDKTFS